MPPTKTPSQPAAPKVAESAPTAVSEQTWLMDRFFAESTRDILCALINRQTGLPNPTQVASKSVEYAMALQHELAALWASKGGPV